eukprot:TRINITY_DN2979_c0_g1_i1.p1 TRINITY_DN2979_c0_g1~~TRINITY_DN2979_c0_g1_i1.p1  ORF type:complete len:684 (+),score=109.95 TRINITY_DN2979_c0_g1_i1:105-2156(+)
MGSATKSSGLGRALLFEHLPELRFRQCVGVLFVVFASGDAFFYPLNDHTKGNLAASAKPLTSDAPQKKFGKSNLEKYDPNAKPTITTSRDSNKPSTYDVTLSLSPDIYRVHTFDFPLMDDGKSFITPRKILLSPDKQLLMIIGVIHKGNTSLVIYRIYDDDGSDCFKVVYNDMSFTFIDACFSPDSRSIVAILSRYPSFIFIMNLPLDQVPTLTNASTSSAPSTSSNGSSKTSYLPNGKSTFSQSPSPHKTISFEPRKIGPMTILGPAFGVHKQPLRMTRISNNYSLKDDSELFHYVTWNSEGWGEYCLWRVTHEEGAVKFEFVPRLVLPILPDRDWLDSDSTPKSFIVDIQFSPPPNCTNILLVIKRDKYPKQSNNGIGLQVVTALYNSIPIDPSNPPPHPHPTHYSSDKLETCWYQLSEEGELSDILCCKWSEPLLLGVTKSAAVIIKSKGLFELVDHYYGSSFQNLYEMFVKTVCSFVQVGPYHRFWLDQSGTLRVIIVTPQVESPHPEWKDLFQCSQTDILNMRILGRRVGYFINNVLKESQSLGTDLFLPKKPPRKGQSTASDTSSSSVGGKYFDTTGVGLADMLVGLHLYRCWQCQRILLKPLECSACKSVVYCSRECQKDNWRVHKTQCIPYPYPTSSSTPTPSASSTPSQSQPFTFYPPTSPSPPSTPSSTIPHL